MFVSIKYSTPGGEILDDRVEVEDADLWSLDHTLAKVIYPALVAFKEVLSDPDKVAGCPSDYLFGRCDADGTYTNEQFEEACSLWHADIDKMIVAFKSIAEDDVNTKHHVIQEGLEIFAKRYQNLWW